MSQLTRKQVEALPHAGRDASDCPLVRRDDVLALWDAVDRRWVDGKCYVCGYHGSVRPFGSMAGSDELVYLDAVCIDKVTKLVPLQP